MICSPKEARLIQDYSSKVSPIASSILAAGHVSPDHLLLTLIDPWFILLKRLDSYKTIPQKFLPLLLPFWLRVMSVQIIFF